MAAATETRGHFRFSEPDTSIPPEERGVFSLGGIKDMLETDLPLHNFWSDPNIIKGIEGLDVQGFIYIKHQSALSGEEWFTENNVEHVYFPEIVDLVKRELGAKSVVVQNCGFRRRLAEKQADPNFFNMKGGPMDKELAKLPNDIPIIYGREVVGSLEPERKPHIDYSADGTRTTTRECRKDMREAARAHWEAEDRGDPNPPRYAYYSIWRPLRTVRRDPLAVCDWRTVDKSELFETRVRAISDVNENGEYILGGLLQGPPKDPASLRWYWVPEQKPDEVLIVKAGDSLAERDPNVSAGAPHVSPIIPGTENEEARCSVETRVMVLW